MTHLTAFHGTEENTKDNSRVIVRVTTSCWQNCDGIYYKKSVRFLQRKCIGHNFILEECENLGAFDFIPMIVNFHEVTDGMYEVVINRLSRDWESGVVDDWDWILVKYEEQ